MKKLDDTARDGELAALLNSGWAMATDRDAITKEFKFSNFPAAMSFMVHAGFAAEKMNHHPEWSNIYSRVWVTLTTHDADGLTELDVKLGQVMDQLAG